MQAMTDSETYTPYILDRLREAAAEGVIIIYAGDEPVVLDCGMENTRQAYIALRMGGYDYLLVERRNCDGEWEPLLFPAGEGTDYRRQVDRIGEFADEIEPAVLVQRQMMPPDEENYSYFTEFLWSLLYDFRDTIAPNALDT